MVDMWFVLDMVDCLSVVNEVDAVIRDVRDVRDWRDWRGWQAIRNNEGLGSDDLLQQIITNHIDLYKE